MLDLAKDVAPRRLADRHDGRMAEAALRRDGIELLNHGIDAANGRYLVLPADMIRDYCGGDEQSGSCLAESLHQSAVVKLTDDAGPQLVGFEPLKQLGSNRDVLAGE